jgi:hypothetical protein
VQNREGELTEGRGNRKKEDEGERRKKPLQTQLTKDQPKDLQAEHLLIAPSMCFCVDFPIGTLPALFHPLSLLLLF